MNVINVDILKKDGAQNRSLRDYTEILNCVDDNSKKLNAVFDTR